MKSIITTLLLTLISTNLALAGGETGNGRSAIMRWDLNTGTIMETEIVDLYRAKTMCQMTFLNAASEEEAIAQATARLELLDPEFAMYFSESLARTLKPQVALLDSESQGNPTSQTGNTPQSSNYVDFPIPSDSTLVQISQTTVDLETLEVFSIYNHSSLSATSRAALKIQAAIYLLMPKFQIPADSSLASDLMIQLLAVVQDESEIQKLTHVIFPLSVRELVFAPL